MVMKPTFDIKIALSRDQDAHFLARFLNRMPSICLHASIRIVKEKY
jgi:hypothetical protein